MGFLARLMGLLASTYYFVGSLSVASPAAGLHMLCIAGCLSWELELSSSIFALCNNIFHWKYTHLIKKKEVENAAIYTSNGHISFFPNFPIITSVGFITVK